MQERIDNLFHIQSKVQQKVLADIIFQTEFVDISFYIGDGRVRLLLLEKGKNHVQGRRRVGDFLRLIFTEEQWDVATVQIVFPHGGEIPEHGRKM